MNRGHRITCVVVPPEHCRIKNSTKMLLVLSIIFVTTGVSSLTPGQVSPLLKTWNKNTNLDTLSNWVGFEEICSKNILSFPMDMDRTVISIPPNSTISAKQIILPRNGHLVFREGSTAWFNSPSETCQGAELKFLHTSRGDWFDFGNWDGRGDSLLNSGGVIPHVERVPCQYDSVQFPAESSYHLLISSDVVVAKFFLGEEELNYTAVAFLMSTPLGIIQFRKPTGTQFSIVESNWSDSDDFICKNYQSPIREKVCSFARCVNVDDKCENPVIPHGFCCPICGYHLKIEHNGALVLKPVKERAKAKMDSLGLNSSNTQAYFGRYGRKLAHIVFIPWMNKTKDVAKLVDEIRIFLKADPSVTTTTVVKSWDDASSSSLQAGGGNAGEITLIVFFILILIGITAFLVFLWTKHGGFPTITVNSILSRLPPLPRMGGDGTSPRPSFSFARFSNERISNINIGATISGDIQRTEEVDSETKPIELVAPSDGDHVASMGFTNATYDLIDVGDSPGAIPSTSVIPEEDEHIYDLVEIHPDSSAILQGKMEE